MKEKRKGFTLIELLAVIVILAIIALVATPIVLKLIETSRKGAFARSAEGVLKASKLYYTTSIINEVTPDTIKFNCNNIKCLSNEKDSIGNSIELDVDGNMGTGNVTITSEGKIELILGNGRYCAEKGKDETKIKVSKKICGEIIVNKPQDLTISSKTGKAGEITVVGSVSNDDSEIKMYEFSIDNGLTWKKAENKTYTFTELEIGKTYEILMRVTNMKDEQEQIKSDSITTSLIDDIEYEISNKNEWSISKTVSITGPKIDENIYKVIYSFDGENYQDYVEPIEFTENGAVKVDIVKKEDGTSILNKVITINVIKVDSTTPNTIELTYTYDNVNLTLTALATELDGEIYGYAFSIDDGQTWTNYQEDNYYTFSENISINNLYKLKAKVVNKTYTVNGEIDNNRLYSDTISVTLKRVYPVVYYNPVTNSKCTESEYDINLNSNDTNLLGNNKKSPTNLKTGCMKWYQYEVNDNGTVNLLLDHNTSANVDSWNDVYTQLENDTSTWTTPYIGTTIDDLDYSLYRARLLTADEVAKITGIDYPKYTSSNYNSIYLDGKQMPGQSNSEYSWMFNYTYVCEAYGCDINDNNRYPYSSSGYWLSTTFSSSNAWYIGSDGILGSYPKTGRGNLGIRPVITIAK